MLCWLFTILYDSQLMPVKVLFSKRKTSEVMEKLEFGVLPGTNLSSSRGTCATSGCKVENNSACPRTGMGSAQGLELTQVSS